MKLIFATHNIGKVKEMKAILSGLDIEVLSAAEAGIVEDIVEDGLTFEENAFKKARFVAERSGEWAAADDSGLCIKALDNAPGVFSARWAGEGVSAEELVQYTLSKMEKFSENERDAWFETAAVLFAPDGRHWTFLGKVEGSISKNPAGLPRIKLPYDVIFVPKGYKQTFAEMSDAEKNSLSHRGLAFARLREFIKSLPSNC